MTAGMLWQPYADGTMGQQGDASADAEPDRRDNIPLAYWYVTNAQRDGITSWEIEQDTGRGHGGISGALSNLHRSGTIVRLKARRGKHSIYVLPQYVDGRAVAPYNRNKKHHPMQDVLDRIDLLVQEVGPTGTDHWDDCWKIHVPCALRKASRVVAGIE